MWILCTYINVHNFNFKEQQVYPRKGISGTYQNHRVYERGGRDRVGMKDKERGGVGGLGSGPSEFFEPCRVWNL